MRHEKWIKVMHLLGTGECSNRERQQLEEHLLVCDACAAEFKNLNRDLDSLTQGLKEESISAPPGLADSIMNKVARENLDMPQPHFLSRARPVLQVASLILVFLFLIEQIQMTQSLRQLEADLQLRAQLSQARPRILPRPIRERMLILMDAQRDKLEQQVGDARGLKAYFSFEQKEMKKWKQRLSDHQEVLEIDLDKLLRREL